jgi:hypothetical protein
VHHGKQKLLKQLIHKGFSQFSNLFSRAKENKPQLAGVAASTMHPQTSVRFVEVAGHGISPIWVSPSNSGPAPLPKFAAGAFR